MSITLEQNLAMFKERFKDKNKQVLYNTKLRESSPIDEFNFQEVEVASQEKPIKFIQDPIYEIFNQQRLNRLGSTTLEAWIESMMVLKNNPLSELREKCSDADLLSVMRSRYCQTPSEVMNWARYLNNNLSDLEKEVSLAREQQQQMDQSAQQTANVAAADSAAAN